MPDPIFIRPDDHYDSYTDYWRLVDLCGFPTGTLADIQPHSDNTYILTMLNLGAWQDAGLGWPGASARIIYWDIEWHDVDYHHVVPGLNEFWSSDRWYAQARGYTFVPMGSHQDLIQCSYTARWNGAALYDVVLMAYMGPPRRQDVANEMKAAGLMIAPNAWGEQRTRNLQQSKIMVNIHQHDAYPCTAAQRWAMAASAGLPLLTEHCADSSPYIDGEDYWGADKGELATAAKILAYDADAGRKLAANFMRKACGEYRFDKNVRRALG